LAFPHAHKKTGLAAGSVAGAGSKTGSVSGILARTSRTRTRSGRNASPPISFPPDAFASAFAPESGVKELQTKVQAASSQSRHRRYKVPVAG